MSGRSPDGVATPTLRLVRLYGAVREPPARAGGRRARRSKRARRRPPSQRWGCRVSAFR